MWVTRVKPWVDGWDQAEENVALATPAHTEASYRAYLSWYQPQTRCRLIYADMQPQPHVATTQDGYARHRDEALAGVFEICRLMDLDARANLMRIRGGSMMNRNEQESAWTRVSQRAHSILEAFGSRTSYDDSYGSSQASTSFPYGPTQQQSSQAPYWSQQHYPGDAHPPYQPHGGTQFSTMAPAAGDVISTNTGTTTTFRITTVI